MLEIDNNLLPVSVDKILYFHYLKKNGNRQKKIGCLGIRKLKNGCEARVNNLLRVVS